MQKQDPFAWLAVYKDGSRFPEYNPDGTVNLYKDIDRTQLLQMLIIERATGKAVHIVHATDPNRVIVRRRVLKDAGDNHVMTVWIVGCQNLQAGRNVQTITAIFPDGHTESADRFVKDHEWLYPLYYFPQGAPEPVMAVMDGVNHPVDAGECWDFSIND